MEEVEGAKSSRSQKGGGDTSPTNPNRHPVKSEVCAEVLKRLAEAGAEAVAAPGFAEDLQAHFNRLPTRYALDVNTERAEDVLTHKNLLHLAETPENRPAFHVRPVHVLPVSSDAGDGSPGTIEEEVTSPLSSPSRHDDAGNLIDRHFKINHHPPPSFGSTPNLEALALDLNNRPSHPEEDKDDAKDHSSQGLKLPHAPMHEVTFSTIDKPKLLSQLSALLADVGLNIREAHVFSTVDGYSLDVFVVDGWPTEDTKELGEELERILANMEEGAWSKSLVSSPKSSPPQPAAAPSPQTLSRQVSSTDSTNDWEIDNNQLKLTHKVASGAFGDLFRGTYCGQDVAIKILKPERLNDNLQREFEQEIFIMRKIRHKNVVQFIGACTKPPNLSIVTEYMSGGSVYDYLHKHKAVLKIPMLLRVAMDISKGMDYLHQNNIIHRDLKAANLLMDENEVVKVADFGVARVQDHSGIMTAETGTYRWMAPEVIEHKPYDRKVDVFSFGVVLWELLTGKLPYADLTPLQAAVGVVQKGLRPTIPKHTNPKLVDLLERCWKTDPAERPEFSEVTVILHDLLKEIRTVGEDDLKRGEKKGFLSALKRSANNR
ncbi:protein MpMAPKKK20 [Marchantia polymorpha subsp. ruderalis]|uniref:non-specific serine/threonine protein kinase n=2 Tax=Marchantia polymorpha TaxID=3197 RepID=A0A176VD59_MARPO|nr:hypothetical protein AXG93_163s1400 [Marchantia polymorpha subsp. ruderalis]PTQ34747.1 hypothetical protein MARPO_0077s0063 [Marchantia polymorpha]BBN18135.1 hypothetical protein Mp_8g00050 [Marchantia polymorpha subsp. ruderalis]|eukprot:PTQ34747.1 hypothetical protein MARPO_0077s0063 [Marchantia polymorpha]